MTSTTHTYTDGIILRNGTPQMWQFDGGYVALNASAASTSLCYCTKDDHLGRSTSRKGGVFVAQRRKNVRSVVKEGQNNPAEVQQTHYYPFGGIIADISSGTSVQNKLYNGQGSCQRAERKLVFNFPSAAEAQPKVKELDASNNLWWYDYGARQYDPTAPRFTTPDPMAEKYYPWNYFTYCMNNPMRFVDPDGMASSDFVDENGKLVSHVDDGSNAVFEQRGSGQDKHYEFDAYNNQNGENIVNMTSAIQEQQKLNNSNSALQERNRNTYCNIATQNIMKTVASATNDKGAIVTGLANSMIRSMKNESNSYEVVDYQTASTNAQNGGLSFVGYDNPSGHGHIATFAVGDNVNPEYKETIANIGLKAYSGFVKLNSAISSKKEKTYFIYKQNTTTE